jgi:hypothetical protein
MGLVLIAGVGSILLTVVIIAALIAYVLSGTAVKKYIAIFMAVLGVIFFALGTVKYSGAVAFEQVAVRAEGTVTEIVDTTVSTERKRRAGSSAQWATLTIGFVTASGEQVSASTDTIDMTIQPGDSIELYYDPANPTNIAIGDITNPLKDVWAACARSGKQYIMLGLVLFVIMLLLKRRAVALVAGGNYVMATVTEVNKSAFLPRCLRRVNAEYSANGVVHKVKSAYVCLPSKQAIPDEVKVYLKADNPKKYYMDTDWK